MNCIAVNNKVSKQKLDVKKSWKSGAWLTASQSTAADVEVSTVTTTLRAGSVEQLMMSRHGVTERRLRRSRHDDLQLKCVERRRVKCCCSVLAVRRRLLHILRRKAVACVWPWQTLNCWTSAALSSDVLSVTDRLCQLLCVCCRHIHIHIFV